MAARVDGLRRGDAGKLAARQCQSEPLHNNKLITSKHEACPMLPRGRSMHAYEN